jgi:hypothetical protein
VEAIVAFAEDAEGEVEFGGGGEGHGGRER